MASRRIVFTGMGVLSPIGLTLDAVWQSLLAGRSGIAPIRAFDPSGLPVRFAGEVVGFDAKNYIDKKERKSLKVMARTIQLAVAAAQLALDDCRLDKNAIDPTRFGVEFGAGLIASELEELAPASVMCANCQPGSIDLIKWGRQGMATMPPLWMLKYLPNMLACHVSILHNAQGPNNSITESDVASLLALGEAYRILQRDQADFFLVGGAESKINPLSMVRQCLFQPLSRRNDAPQRACRPFDRQHDGMVIGEGASVFALEELEHARRRGARIYAELVGYGAAFDRDLSGRGLARAIRIALDEAGIGPEDVDHVNAHGLGVPARDAWEAAGLCEVFGRCSEPVPVWGPKSYIGNLGAGAGTTELAFSLLAMQRGLLPPTLNHEEPAPDCPVNVVAGSPRPVKKSHVVKLAFTDMGQCAAVVCRKWD
ncbi:MAG: beta-ketoacyl-[acyl-carrier-protein] synthase family protein [Gemmataceae bacterium]|nr:beta-ketoacyl-[acyl-carrier-protein] synthase family protein [Gemmataceae bacterium]MDW8263904.1 beta-ketoacyl-[acyl-carrier-protein] synthase family protein [Gemmataceae bacterium]